MHTTLNSLSLSPLFTMNLIDGPVTPCPTSTPGCEPATVNMPFPSQAAATSSVDQPTRVWSYHIAWHNTNLCHTPTLI